MDNNKPLVLFDYGNVLALHDRLEICGRLAKHSPLNAEEVAARLFGTDLEYDSETGRYDSREHFRRIKAAIDGAEPWSYDQFVDEFKNVFTLNGEAVRALELAARHARVFILSNTPYLHSLWLFEQEVLATLPESYIFSYKVAVMKPDPRIWQIALDRAGVAADRCLFIDDNEQFCAVARRLGISSLHYRISSTDLVGEVTRWLEEMGAIGSAV